MSLHAALGLAALVAASACGTGTSLPTSGPVAVYEASGEGGSSALLEGRLRLEGDCLTVVPDETGGQPVVPIFADSSEPGSSSQGLRFAGDAYPAGTTVALGGGFTSRAVGDQRDVDGYYVPGDCDAGLPTYIVSQDVDSLRP